MPGVLASDRRGGNAGPASRRWVAARRYLTARDTADSRLSVPGETAMPHKPAQAIAILATGLGLLVGSILTGAAEPADPFYRGKTINFLVASVPGGVNDLTARLI